MIFKIVLTMDVIFKRKLLDLFCYFHNLKILKPSSYYPSKATHAIGGCLKIFQTVGGWSQFSTKAQV
jgi:hypothetical protein